MSSPSLDNSVNESAGLVLATGAKCAVCPDPYTPQRLGPGSYQVSYPAKTWTHAGSLPVPVVTAFNGNDIRGRVPGSTPRPAAR